MNFHQQLKTALILVFFVITTISCSGSGLSTEQIQTLPKLSLFASAPSTSFLVDLEDVSHTSPFVGSNNNNPHDGAHVHFDNDGLIPDGSYPSAYPPIYAVADGVITSIDDYETVGENYKYNIELTFAQDGGESVEFQYSIEPMIDPGNATTYQPFILVTEGQTVSQSDVIAYMLVMDGIGDGPHIHFNIMNDNTESKQAPAIFSSDIMTEFYSKLEEAEECMGTDLTADENPSETGAVDCL